MFESFQIHVFTLPAEIQVEISFGGTVVDLIDLTVPGGHVKTLTSTSRLIKEYEFSKRSHYIDYKAS